MKIEIEDSFTLLQVQHAFSAVYKYLKLEFFKKSHEAGEGSARKDMLPHNKTLGEVRSKHNHGSVTFTNHITVHEFEQLFEQHFGIHVQVFRKSGNTWLETTKTDNWTLEHQNYRAAENEVPSDLGSGTYEVD